MNGVIDADKLTILESCALGFCKNVQSIRELAISFCDAGCSDFKIMLVWHPSLQIMTRRIWLSIRGILIHAWSEATFRNITPRWGILVEIDQDSLAPSSFETCCIQIETDWNSHIDEKFNLEVDSVLFPIQVMVVEEAIGPKCECCCGIDVVSQGNLSHSSKALEGELDTICKIGKVNDTVVADSIDTLEGSVAEKPTQDRPKFNLDRIWLENRQDDARILDLSVSTIPDEEVGLIICLEGLLANFDVMTVEGQGNWIENADIHKGIMNAEGQDNRMEIAYILNDIMYVEG
ncbi:hypothetical protein V6N11_019292 [Hibiscus sabdariffa]|uniref:DUF4283 domain-containing protein n=1 Tax=Hibiscus sabdariffa TaxID=183260 RepID=A0ABR2R1X6_9ROSI